MNVRTLILAVLSFLFFGHAQDNPHGAINIACETCHNSSDWNTIQVFKFNHDQTGFELKYAHKSIYCAECHENMVFKTGQKLCIDCHQDIHKAELGFQCQKCHSEKRWNERSLFIEMHSQTNFPLVGVHNNIDCESCHFIEQQKQYTNISTQCSSCHLQDYMAALNPEHQKSGFNLDCRECHLIAGNSWKAPNFPHPASFPLTGGHGGLQCLACHVSNQYASLSTDCYFCHENDYANTQNPSHQSVEFSTTCEDCHTIKSWGSANWDHDASFFPIYSGKHRGEWNNCKDCHVSAPDYSHFECIECHAHRKSRMDSEHDDERNYQYNSVACYDCHPRGKADD